MYDMYLCTIIDVFPSHTKCNIGIFFNTVEERSVKKLKAFLMFVCIDLFELLTLTDF